MRSRPHGTVGSVQIGLVRFQPVVDAVRRVGWPLLVVAGLAQVAFCLAPWGASPNKAGASITGLGRVSVPGAGRADVAFLEAHTQRPAVTALVCGALIVMAALAGWWQRGHRWAPLSVAAAAALASVISTALVAADVTGSLLDHAVTAALGGDTTLRTGYGVVGALVIGGLALVGTLAALAGMCALGRRDHQ